MGNQYMQNSTIKDDFQKQKLVNEAKYSAIQKIAQESELLNTL